MLELIPFAMLITGGGRERARNEAAARAAAELAGLARLEGADALARLDATPDGLKHEQIEERLETYGPNVVAQEKKKPFLLHILERFVTNLERSFWRSDRFFKFDLLQVIAFIAERL